MFLNALRPHLDQEEFAALPVADTKPWHSLLVVPSYATFAM